MEITEKKLRIAAITTGGTIAKTYNEWDGSLRNDRPIVESIIGSLRLPDMEFLYEHILNKDSLDLTDQDRQFIIKTVANVLNHCNGVVVVHGTDTLAITGEWLHREFPNLTIPVVLTGAMRPFEFRDSDAAQNVTEALLACRLLSGGVYVAMHNRVLKFPGVHKDRKSLTFVENGGARA